MSAVEMTWCDPSPENAARIAGRVPADLKAKAVAVVAELPELSERVIAAVKTLNDLTDAATEAIPEEERIGNDGELIIAVVLAIVGEDAGRPLAEIDQSMTGCWIAERG